MALKYRNSSQKNDKIVDEAKNKYGENNNFKQNISQNSSDSLQSGREEPIIHSVIFANATL